MGFFGGLIKLSIAKRIFRAITSRTGAGGTGGRRGRAGRRRY